MYLCFLLNCHSPLRLRHLEARLVFPTTVSVQTGKNIDEHTAFNNINKNNNNTGLGAHMGTADRQTGVNGVESSAASNFLLESSAGGNFLPKQISSSLSSGLSVGSVKVFSKN